LVSKHWPLPIDKEQDLYTSVGVAAEIFLP